VWTKLKFISLLIKLTILQALPTITSYLRQEEELTDTGIRCATHDMSKIEKLCQTMI